MTLSNFFSPSGEMKRLEYFISSALTYFFVLLFIFSPSILQQKFPEFFSGNLWKITFFISYFFGIVGFFYTYGFCLNSKRLRDMGYSAWWSILILAVAFVPYIKAVVLLLFIYPSNKQKSIILN